MSDSESVKSTGRKRPKPVLEEVPKVAGGAGESVEDTIDIKLSSLSLYDTTTSELKTTIYPDWYKIP
jgi:hypothetical protein